MLTVKKDYFVVSLPDILVFDVDLQEKNRIHCHYLLGLGYIGLGDWAEAVNHFNMVLAMDANHLGAVYHRNMAKEKSYDNHE